MKRIIIIAAIAMLGILVLVSGAKAEPDSEGKIQGLIAIDAPNDDGSGVILKWKPLHKSHRIIQYKIYRGPSPDSLFFFNSLEVDPTLGVVGDELSFRDADFQPLFEFETAPSKLKKEKHQAKDSPLYRAVPRDPEVIGKLIPHYTVLGAIKESVFHHGSRQVKIDDQTMAGYKLNQFDFIYANPIAGHDYYYSVLAVNEKGRHLPAADVVSATPMDNRPSATAQMAATWIEDTRDLGFEWSPPESGDDVAMYFGWLLPKELKASFEQEQLLNEAAADSVFHANWQKQAIPLFQYQVTSDAQRLYEKVNLEEAGITLPRPASEYLPLLSYMDYSEFQNAVLTDTLYVKHSSQLPVMPSFIIQDKKNDKGDSNLISMGTPVAYVTQASYTSAKKDKLKFNYEVLENELYPIERLRFKFSTDDGKDMGAVTEYYPDKVIYLKVGKDFNGIQSFKVQAQVMLRADKKYLDQAATQDVTLDARTRRYLGQNLCLNGKRLDLVFLDIFTKRKLGSVYNPGLRSNGMIRAQEHTIPFPDVTYQQIHDYDPKTHSLLMAPNILVAIDQDKGFELKIPLYRDEFKRGLKKTKSGITELTKKLEQMTANGDTLSEAFTSLKEELDYTKGSYDFVINYPAFKAAEKARSEKAWRKIMLNEASQNKRTFSYQFLLTDGHGFFHKTDSYKDEKGNIWFFPKAQWFDMSKLGTLFGSLLFGFFIVLALFQSKRRDLFIRPIAGLEELDNAVGRATEMGRPVMFVPGWGTLGDPCTISAMMILSQTAHKTAEFDVRLISPHVDYMVMPVAQEIVMTAYSEAGRPDSFNRDDIFFISDSQFAFSAGVNGITIRERVATILYMGFFNAEALLMTETGNQTGAIQIAGTDAITQVPFFITTCDYTLIGEEFYAASAYLSKNIELVSMLKGSDYFKLVMVIMIFIGTILSTAHWHGLLHFLPFE